MKSGITSLVVASLLASAGFATFAQTTPQEAAPAPATSASIARHDHGHMGVHGKMDPAKRDVIVANRRAELKAKLKITAEQEGAWNSFTTAMKPAAHMEYQRPDGAQLDKRADATKTFYGALNADQKKLFDAEHAHMGRRDGGHHGGAARQ